MTYSIFIFREERGEKTQTTFVPPDDIPLSSLICSQLFCLKALGTHGKLLCDFYLHD